jgi:hypothetical protein
MSLESFLYENLYAPLPYLFWAAMLAFAVSVVIFHIRVRAKRTLLLLVTTALMLTSVIAGQVLTHIFNLQSEPSWHLDPLPVAMRIFAALEGYFGALVVLSMCICLVWPKRRYDA